MRSRGLERRGRGGEVEAGEAAQGGGGGRGGTGAPAEREVAHENTVLARDHGVLAREQGVLAREHGVLARGRAEVHHRGGREVDRQRAEPRKRGGGGQRRGGHAGPRPAGVGRARFNGRVTFTRIAWLVTVFACVVT